MNRLAWGHRYPLIGLAGAFAVVAFWAQRNTSATFDEPLHVMAARRAAAGDLRFNPEHPALFKRLAGLPLPAPEPGGAAERWAGQSSEGWGLAIAELDGASGGPRTLVEPARVVAIGFGALLVVATGWAARPLGSRGALVAAAACAADPNLIAHAGVVAYDVPAAACLALVGAAAAALAARPRWGQAVLAGLALGAALACKHSALLALPGLAVWLVWRVRSGRILAAVGLAAALTVGVAHGGVAPYLDSAARLLGGDAVRPERCYLLGEQHLRAPWHYLPVVLAAKLSPPLALGAVGLGLALRGPARDASGVLLAMAGAQLFLLSAGGYGLGVRYALLAIPALALGLGALAASRRGAPIALALLALHAADLGRVYPHYLAYFTPPLRAAGEAGRIAADSNLDWGQDLPALADWRARQPAPLTLYLAYCGTATPAAYGLSVRHLPGFGGYALAGTWTDAPAPPAPRAVLAVSANHALGLLGLPGAYAELVAHEPIDRAGRSIWLYAVDAELHAWIIAALAQAGDVRVERQLDELGARADRLAIATALGPMLQRRGLAQQHRRVLHALAGRPDLSAAERAALSRLGEPPR